ncbi:hypothetical protein [Actinoplanes sp. HUAS TT8]|uniref:hypothetical protein n=1 Tax=Actinoplanes sp. HUAS TT8 TaxID=3447453 RepID=UPI003F51D297
MTDVRRDDDTFPAAVFGVAGGCAVVIAAAMLAAGLFAPARAGELIAMAVTVAVLAAVTTDGRACLVVTGFAALVYVGFLAHRHGDLTGATGWPDTILLGGAALLGRSRRWTHVRIPAARFFDALLTPHGGRPQRIR